MLSGEGNENGEKQLCTVVQHTFFAHFYVVVLHDYNVKLQETYTRIFFLSLRTSLTVN